MKIEETHLISNTTIASCWFQPIRKILVKLDHFPSRGENKTYVQTTNWIGIVYSNSFWLFNESPCTSKLDTANTTAQGQKQIIIRWKKNSSTPNLKNTFYLCQVLQVVTEFGPIWVPFSGLKRPPLRESKCHFEDAGMYSLGLISMEPTKNCSMVQMIFLFNRVNSRFKSR